MSQSIHGHEVMEMMIELKKSFTKETLNKTIIKRFGQNARFHTCSTEHMTAVELINFLEERGKFIDGSGGFTTDPDKICNH